MIRLRKKIKLILERILSKRGYSIVPTLSLKILINIQEKYGYKLSQESLKPLGPEGQPIPWFTYPAIEFISQFDLTDKTIFEWGSGNSSLYFSNRCKTLVSVENNKEWFRYVEENKSPNNHLILSEIENYAEKIDDNNDLFDVIIIDAERRYDCAVRAFSHLRPGGMIILDNADWLPQTSKLLGSIKELIQIDFHGFGPVNAYSWTTTIFMHREFDFEARGGLRPHYSLASLKQLNKWDNQFIK